MAEERHLTGEQLGCLARGEASADERQAALAHLHECELCGDRLAAILLLREMRPRRARGLWTKLAGTAAVVLTTTAVAYALALWGSGTAEPEPLPPERQALVDRWAGFARRGNLRPDLYDFTLRVLYPDVVPVSPDQHMQQTREALIDLRDNRYQLASEKLLSLHLEHPDFDSIAGWLGVAMFLSGETDPLVGQLLDRGTRAEVTLLREGSLWYEAQRLLLTGAPEEAIPKLSRLAAINDSMGRMARDFLDQLPLQELQLRAPDGDPGIARTSLKKRVCRHAPLGAHRLHAL